MLDPHLAKQTKTKKKAKANSSVDDPIKQYALDVTGGKEIAGPLVRLACARHLRDLEEGEARGVWWDLPAALYRIEFFESVLHLAGGEHEGKPFVLHPSQKFIAGSLFGWKGPDGYRRFRVAYIEEGKGNGKSPLLGGIGLYMLTADDEPRAEVYAVGHDKAQAQVLFRDAVAMVDQSDELDSRITRSGGTGKEWNLAYHETGSFFRPISSEHVGGRGKSGPRPHCVLIDELHEHPSSHMVEFMRAGTKGRRQALIVMITNSGVFNPSSVCWSYHDYADKVLNQLVDNDSFFAYVCGLDEGDDWKDRRVWKKANPLLGVSITEKYLEEQVREATGMPSKQSIVRRLNFCEWVEAADPWITPETWRSNRGVDTDAEWLELVESLKGRECFGGLDLSRKNDLTALVLVFILDDGTKAALPFFWKPDETLAQHAERDKVDYVGWKERGLLLTTPGPAINYEFVAAELNKLAARYSINAIAFDPAKIDELTPYLNDIGADIQLKEHRQGFLEMDAPIQNTEDDLANQLFRHNNHEILSWCVTNAKAVQNSEEKRMLDKRKSRGRIDGATALVMANGLAGAPVAEASYSVTMIP